MSDATDAPETLRLVPRRSAGDESDFHDADFRHGAPRGDLQDVVLRTDSFIQRRRSFVAAPRPAPVPPTAPVPATSTSFTPALATTANTLATSADTPSEPKTPLAVHDADYADDEDLPVLTEVVPPEASVGGMTAAALEDRLAHQLASALGQTFSAYLERELPALIEAACQNLADTVRRDVRAIGENALKEFLAHRGSRYTPPDTASD
ncbi:hypothetical protein HCX48_07395 [Rhodocyclus tenuis]|uniref:DUF2486 family protein n=1 Tax=Rhodocyclus gracilis TaxID=2929842 RepID=A0ABX0WK71_9RHOO|nr:hypothetical protein [Rhodocyclus gracilis]NJA89044.1 hypothetical protein [Rhodocyclus gracilis]